MHHSNVKLKMLPIFFILLFLSFFIFLCSGSVEECVLNLSCPCLGFTLKDLKLVGKCVGTLGTLSSPASV